MTPEYNESDADVTTDGDSYHEVVVVGGGPAGLTAALYTTRLNHDTALVDRGGGRAAMMLEAHNVIGVPEDVSGNEFLETAKAQLDGYGTEMYREVVTDLSIVNGDNHRFEVTTTRRKLGTDALVLATGFTDERPDPPLPRTGRGLHYCLHCDGYMFRDESVYVMGHDDAAAHVATILLNFTDDVDLLLRGSDPTWDGHTDRLVRAHPIDVVEAEIEGMYRNEDDDWLGGFEFSDGTRREYRGGFAMYGAEYNNALAAQLGCEINDDGTVAVDDQGRTTVERVYAVGDLTPGHNQIPVAMGDGARAGIAVHKQLRTYPRSLDALQ